MPKGEDSFARSGACVMILAKKESVDVTGDPEAIDHTSSLCSRESSRLALQCPRKLP